MKNTTSKDLKILRQKVGRLKRAPLKKIKDATCDIIEMKGYALAVLLRRLPEFDAERQRLIAQKIEDFLYFHPESGKRLIERLQKACEQTTELCQAQLFSAIIDVLGANAEKDALSGLMPIAQKVLCSSADFLRKAKALEVLNLLGKKESLIFVIKNMMIISDNLDKFSNYYFFENSLLVLKSVGGEAVLKLLISPNSDNVIRQFRTEWRSEDPSLIAEILRVLQSAAEDFAQIALKVVDLSDFNLPFVSMIQEGMLHQDKWVRQAAAVSMEKASSALDPEVLAKMLRDDAPEVRMMAVASLGGYPAKQTGEILEKLVQKPGETPGSKMNALYALYSQKNLPALERLTSEPEAKIALNALGLASMLRPKVEGLADLMKVFAGLGPERSQEVRYYLLEIAEPEDLPIFVDYHKNANGDSKKENCLGLLRYFLQQKAGPRLDQSLSRLPDAQRKALSVLALSPVLDS